MKSSHSSGEEIYIPPNPHHPEESFKYPKRSFGKAKIVERSFQPSWFVKWSFLHYDEVADRVMTWPSTAYKGDFNNQGIKFIVILNNCF